MENNISDTITPPLSSRISEAFNPSSVNEVAPSNIWFYVKIIFIIVFLALMGLNIFTYLSEGTDIFGKYLGISLMKGAEGTKSLFSTTKLGGDIALDVVEGTALQVIDLPEKKIRKRLNKQQGNQFYHSGKIKEVDTDMAEGNKSYCYIGSENGNRRCVEATKDDVCESDKVFPSMDVCINPYLR
jgi:hypothetical protein